MDFKKKTWIVLRITLCVAGWFIAMKLCAYGIGKLGSKWPELIVMTLSSMLIPYGILLPMVRLLMRKMDAPEGLKQSSLRPKQFLIIIVVQSGFSIVVMFVVNILLTAAGINVANSSFSQVGQYPLFYMMMLLLFNPIVEEYFFRGLVLKYLMVLGDKQAVLISACLFAIPHVVSQGVAQMFYTFILGLVWGCVMVRTNKLQYVIILHAFSNLYGMFLPLILTQSPVGMMIYMALWIVLVPVSAVVLCIKTKRKGINLWHL